MAAKTEVEIGVRDKASAELNGIRGAFERMRVSVETNSKGINKLDGALRGMGAQAASLPGPLGRVADALADFAPGGLAGAAYLAGFGAIIMITKSYFDAAEKTKEINEKLADSIAKIQGNADQVKLDRLRQELRLLGEESESGWRKFWLGSDGRLFGFGLSLQDRQNQIQTDINNIGNTISTGLENAQARLRGSQANLRMQEAEIGGRGAEERVRQAETALVVAQNALGVAQKERKTQEEITKLQADVTDAETARVSAIAALRKKINDDENKQYELRRKQQTDEFNYEIQLAVKASQRKYELFIKELEDLMAAREQSRKVVNDLIANDINKLTAAVTAGIEQDNEAAKKATESAEERMKTIEPIVYGIADGFDSMIDGIMSGDNAFKAFGQGARKSIAGILQALGRQNLVEGLGALGKAFAAAANPLTAPSAPGFFKSAAQHFAASAAAGIASRAVGGAGAGGIGANGGAFNNSQLGQNNFTTQQPLTIVVQGGLLDMSNPETQRSFVSAMETVSNRRVRMVGA